MMDDKDTTLLLLKSHGFDFGILNRIAAADVEDALQCALVALLEGKNPTNAARYYARKETTHRRRERATESIH